MDVVLDTKIRFEVNQPTLDAGYGTPTVNWVEFATVWAEVQDVMPSKSGEAVAHGIRIADRTTRVRCRYRAGLTSAMRIVDLRNGRLMKILTPPATLGQREWMEMLAADFSTAGEAA